MNKKSLANIKRWKDGKMNRKSYIGINLADKNGMWKGKNVKKIALHVWVRSHIDRPVVCEYCGTNKNIDLANIRFYNRDFENWKYLCRKCHMKLDGRLDKLVNMSKSRSNTNVSMKCKVCNKEYIIRKSMFLKGEGIFCSRKCMCLEHKKPEYWKHLLKYGNKKNKMFSLQK